MPHQLKRQHNVHGAFELKKGQLTLRTGAPLLAQEAQQPKDAGRDFTVWLIDAEVVRDFTGRVESVELVANEKPARWEIVMRGKERRP